ncbi:hypothetical protein ERO13_A05G320308v2 [Gossypium hirsutum]|nr:hypothetical protein ERO13_A05G320308v2 [Gossypium hirsutum]KAG4202234.1 hypothetical protein ERO13_A05G320308v2 [Gossypium hirsutum]
MLLMELGLEIFIRHKLLATSGYHSLYQWYRSIESEHFPDPSGLRARMEQWIFGLYPACIKYFMSAFDVPQLWLSPEAIFARMEYKRCLEGVLSYIMLQSSFTSGFSPTLWFLWCSEATCISALTGFIYTLTRHSLISELLITSHSHDSTSIVMVILKFSLLQSIRFQGNGCWILIGIWSRSSHNS